MTGTSHHADGPDDQQLVVRAVAGDRDAFAAIYDRYSDRIHTMSVQMLGDVHEAADVTGDVFLRAGERIAQLRDPARLRAWLYSIARHEIYRRTRQRRRTVPTDLTRTGTPISEEVNAMATITTDPHEADDLDPDELRALIADAAAGLDDGDRFVLELSLRHGLDGAELATALDVAPSKVHVATHRMRTRLERSIVALTVARRGRRDCDELDRMLEPWDGTFDTVWRKRVARHVDGCETCERRRPRTIAALLSSPALAVPLELRPAPPAVRERVLGEVQLAGAGRGRHGRRGWLAGAAAAVLVLVAGLVWWLVDDDTTTNLTTVAGGLTTTTESAAATSTTSAATTSAAPAPTAPLAPVPTTPIVPPPASPTTVPAAAPTTVVAAGTLAVDAAALDFGASQVSRTLVVSHTGGGPVTVTVLSPVSWLAASPTRFSLANGATQAVVLTLDRGASPEGAPTTTLTIGGGVSPLRVAVSGRVGRAPQIMSIDGPTRFGVANAAACRITVHASDETGVSSVQVTWTYAGGPTSVLDLPADGAGAWSAVLTTSGLPQILWTVEVTDPHGAVGTSAPQSTPGGSVCQA